MWGLLEADGIPPLELLLCGAGGVAKFGVPGAALGFALGRGFAWGCWEYSLATLAPKGTVLLASFIPPNPGGPVG